MGLGWRRRRRAGRYGPESDAKGYLGTAPKTKTEQFVLRMVWEVVTGSLPDYSWWYRFSYGEKGTDIDVPGSLIVEVEDPHDGTGDTIIIKTFMASDLLHAYQEMGIRTHCGSCDILGDPDMCSSDLILQWACFGEIVYC
jgi:hypothetical protein